MGLMQLFRGKAEATEDARNGPASVQFMPSQPAMDARAAHEVRKDTLRLVLRECLLRTGIPSGWLAIDILRTSSAQRGAGVHVRFLLRQWQPRVLDHAVAIETAFVQRLLAVDPGASAWLDGFSWQLAMQDRSACPPLPHPGAWTAPLVAGRPHRGRDRIAYAPTSPDTLPQE